ncbi:MAG TPA: pyridoxamine 5'-phosphate oxidase family protein [Propionibacteriaceae bacterium]|nr:pyridoxamine 5'-phosphate oxidase family protein [Propionibacteriaceae bacterium]
MCAFLAIYPQHVGYPKTADATHQQQTTSGALERNPGRDLGHFQDSGGLWTLCTVGPLAGLVRRTSVAFEIDSIDEQHKSGWSVLVLGFAEALAHDYRLTSAWETGPVPWADGVRNLFIEIKPHQISGRAVGNPSRD